MKKRNKVILLIISLIVSVFVIGCSNSNTPKAKVEKMFSSVKSLTEDCT